MKATQGFIKPEDYLNEIIKLQLKKPKNWNWELTTSKSSSHLCLPIIQLFDSKGKLLVEAKDCGTERRTWHSQGLQSNANINLQIQRCSSDILTKKKTPTNKVETNKLNINAIKREKDKNDDLYERMLKNNDLLRNDSNKYITRTSSAGTLLIKEYSFKKPSHRRRKRREEYDSKYESDLKKNVEQKHHPDQYTNCDNTPQEKLFQRRLFYSKSDVFNFQLRNNSNYQSEREESNDDKIVRKRRRKTRKRNTDESTVRKGNEAQGSLKEDKKGDVELERLVRRLSSAENVKMGANVSRHSSKGLSGRRTQSSGSICKGRKNNDNQICGSLPSYLDERDAGCNNNGYEKLPISDVDRIPPLGDGAPLHWKFSDNQTVLCDQGYGSERSPEEEFPPPLPEHDNQCHHHLDIHSCYPFITPESTFCVTLAKGSRGLGLSVTGGIDSGGSWPGLIRVKRLFPHQPAASCGVLNVGDLILEANGIPLTGLTNYEALEVLRTAPSQVELRVCRPPPDVLNCVSPISEVPPPPPRREPPSSLNVTPGQFEDDSYSGEFEITMRKMQGSLGFTLRKEDDSALGHYIRALVREPALTDGRIRPGDKIIAVNDVEISSMSHEEAVQFLRKCGDLVKLRLYRDAAQTPVATLSPTDMTPRTSFSGKAQLRQEAVDMLNDIAVRKLKPNNQDSYRHHSHSPTSSPRKIRSRQNCPSDASQDSSIYYHSLEEQFHEGLLSRGGHLPLDEDTFNSLFIHDDDDCDRPSRPSSLELYNPNQTPVVSRKPKFNFSLAHNAYELNNLDAEILDAPNLTYNIGDDVNSTEVECGDSFPKEPASMPYIPSDNPGFSYKNPAYQSAHPHCGLENGKGDDKKTADESNTKKRTEEEPEKKPRRKKSIKETKTVPEEPKILAIELNRGWNSRLGFSLQGPIGQTYVSAVHADSVAAKDGRIKAGDRVIKVNDESVEHMSTSEIIDLLRIVRGPVCIVVVRDPNKDCAKSNAVN